MTTACRQVMAECDFRPEEVREVELLLLRHSPKQLVSFFWRKDPKGEHRLEWFKPFFVRRYVAETVDARMPGATDDDFWRAYDWWGERAELGTFDLAHVWTMSRDFRRMVEAFDRANVKTPAYVVKVFESIPVRTVPERTRIDFEVGNSGAVKVGGL